MGDPQVPARLKQPLPEQGNIRAQGGQGGNVHPGTEAAPFKNADARRDTSIAAPEGQHQDCSPALFIAAE